MQKELGIVGLFNYRGPDRFNKLILALLVELGECANEQRSWKFWSQDQEPRTDLCKACRGKGTIYATSANGLYSIEANCSKCMGKGRIGNNPLLEEYVDGLHFVLELGLGLNMHNHDWFVESNIKVFSTTNVTDQYNDIFEHVINVKNCDFDDCEEYEDLAYAYLGLGEMLGFTWEEIEQAYFKKNQINHERQDNGY